jgi:hypothetical protein
MRALVAFPAAALGVALTAAPVRAEARSHLSDAQVRAMVEQGLADGVQVAS